jgi:hypothetical protein
MVFLKHVEHRLRTPDEARTIRSHVAETAAQVPGVSLRDFYVLRERDEFILVMECPDEAAYQAWRELCPPPSGATDWVESAILASELRHGWQAR